MFKINQEKAQVEALRSAPEKMKAIFESALAALGEKVDPSTRMALYNLEAGIEKAAARQDWEAVKLAIQGAEIPPEAEAKRKELLSLFNA